MDSAVLPHPRYPDTYLIQTVDFFYPLVDDPYTMGKIALANVASDIYATGVTRIDKLRMIISAPTEFSDAQRDRVIPLIIKGFRDAAVATDCSVEVQNITINPWVLIGGIATSVSHANEIIFPNDAQAGDVLILTKPLGTQLATNVKIWYTEKSPEWEKLSQCLSQSDVDELYNEAIAQMVLLNRTAAELMHKYGAHGATDITGFGLLGHAGNLTAFQKRDVDFVIHALPILKTVKKIAEILGRTQKLFSGNAVETSGGLLIAIPEDQAPEFCAEYFRKTKCMAWEVGRVIGGDKKEARLASDVQILMV